MCLSCTLEWSSPHSRTCMCVLWSCSSPFYIALSEIILTSLCLRSFTYFFFWICVWEKICDNIFPSLALLLSPFPFIFLHPKVFYWILFVLRFWNMPSLCTAVGPGTQYGYQFSFRLTEFHFSYPVLVFKASDTIPCLVLEINIIDFSLCLEILILLYNILITKWVIIVYECDDLEVSFV